MVILLFKTLEHIGLHGLLQPDSEASTLCIPALLQIKCEGL